MKYEFIPRVGIWGQRHYNYLKKSNPTVVNVMRMKGTLEQYLTDLDRDAQDNRRRRLLYDYRLFWYR